MRLKQLKHTAPSQKAVLLQHWDEEVETPRNVLLQQQKNNSRNTKKCIIATTKEQQLKH
jgi:hypothetical protein